MKTREIPVALWRFVLLLVALGAGVLLFWLPSPWSDDDEDEDRPKPVLRVGQEPYRRCVPIGIPDAVPFSYIEGESESVDLPADSRESGVQAARQDGEAGEDQRSKTA